MRQMQYQRVPGKDHLVLHYKDETTAGQWKHFSTSLHRKADDRLAPPSGFATSQVLLGQGYKFVKTPYYDYNNPEDFTGESDEEARVA